MELLKDIFAAIGFASCVISVCFYFYLKSESVEQYNSLTDEEERALIERDYFKFKNM